MSSKIDNRYLREEYLSRINRVIDYIESNMEDKLSLGKLAQVASFSPYHFHRIFKALVGEPLNHFIQRVRLERAAMKLVDQPKLSVTEIAFACGFSGSSSFARAFKDHFQMSATEWRRQIEREKSKISIPESKRGKANSKEWKDTATTFSYIESISQARRYTMSHTESLNVDVKEIPEMHVAYVRHIGPYKGDTELFDKLFNKIFKWAGARDLLRFPETRVLAVYHDNPEITDESKLRTSVCVTVPPDTTVDGEVGKMTIPGGKYAIGHFEIDADGYEDAWNALFGAWLPDSGFQPDDRPAFELFLNNPNEHPEHKHIVDIYVPVKPL